MTTEPQPKRMLAHCNCCGGERNCFVRSEYRRPGSDPINPISWEDSYYILECGGCGEIFMRHDYWFSEDTTCEYDPATREYEEIPDIKTLYYPPARHRQLPRWFDTLVAKDEVLGDVLTEIYTALHSDSLITATAGTRILLDRAMVMMVEDVGHFDTKLRAMLERGIIGQEEYALLEIMTDAGSAASHRGYKPSREHLATIIEIIENLLHRKFVLSDAAIAVKNVIPPRPARKGMKHGDNGMASPSSESDPE